MEVKGKIIQKGLIETVGQAQKQSVIIQLENDKYDKKLCLDFWKEKTDLVAPLPIGANITASINVESREYNGKWFTNVSVWKVESDQKQLQKVDPQPAPQNVIPIPSPSKNDENDDLPF